MTDTNPAPPETVEAKLDHLITLIDQMNRRDRWRTIGGFIRGVVMLVPTLLVLLSSVYLYYYGADLVQELIKQTTAQASQQVKSSFMNDLMKNLPSGGNIQVR